MRYSPVVMRVGLAALLVLGLGGCGDEGTQNPAPSSLVAGDLDSGGYVSGLPDAVGQKNTDSPWIVGESTDSGTLADSATEPEDAAVVADAGPGDTGPTDFGPTEVPDEGPPVIPDEGPPPVPDEGPEPDEGVAPDPPDAGPPPVVIPEVCYPGTANTWDVCFSLTAKSFVTSSAYKWPAGGPNPVQYAEPTWLLDLKTVDGATKLAKNFALDEFMQVAKGQYAVYSPKAVVHWQNIRNALGKALYINSGFRSPGYNAGLDGAATYSRHMYGDAADVTTKGGTTLQAIVNACNAEGADFVKLYTSHVHCDWRNDKLDPAYWADPPAAKPGNWDPNAIPEDEQADAWVPAPQFDFVAGDWLELHAEWLGFPEGTPWVRWAVTGPGLSTVVEPSTSLSVPLDEVGWYRVAWDVGATVSGELYVEIR